MTHFSGNPSDLLEATQYELSVIDYLRFTLYGQSEEAGDGMSLVVGDLTHDGEQRRHLYMRASISVSDGAMRTALDRLRPLAFSAAFKLQDMIAEWILRANRVTDWQFSKKLAAYDKLHASGSLAQPALFTANAVVAAAFWELYRFLVPFRGTVVHTGGVALERDGAISITCGSDVLRFSPSDQGAYMRATCVIAKILLGQVGRNDFLDDLIQACFFSLRAHHRQTGLVVHQSRLEALTVHVLRSDVVSYHPLAVSLDFDHFRHTMERTFPVGMDGRLYYSVQVVVEAESEGNAEPAGSWQLPVEDVPVGLVKLHEGDPAFDRFLQINRP